jgi:pimeloyl-ACP methyl ester carboxylesterase
MDANRFQVEVDGRSLDVWVSETQVGTPIVFHHGTPMSGLPFSGFHEAAAERGMRLITYSRPGYGSSTRFEGRDVGDCVRDVDRILAQLGVDRFLTVGWSGGGPHALACAAGLPDRVIACATIAGVAPHGRPDLDFLEGMAKENIEEFGAALGEDGMLESFLEHEAATLADVTAESLGDALGDLAPDVDRASLTGAFASFMADAVHEALRNGIWGWFDDDIACLTDWPDLASIKAPVTVWQGALDAMVPFAHGRWLADHVPGARARLFDDEGHLSIAIGRFDEILDDLLESA